MSTSLFPAAKTGRSNVASLRSKDPAGNSGAACAQIRGLGPMARVTTSFGQVYAQTLRTRDRVRTKNGEFLEIIKIDRMTLDADYLQYHPAAQPVLIRAGALARGVPAADMMLAPFQILDAQQSFVSGASNKAIDALQRPHVCRKSQSMITYTIFKCKVPATICCEGVWLEMDA